MFSRGIQRLYTMSYMWNSALAVLTTVAVGLVVSFLTGIAIYDAELGIRPFTAWYRNGPDQSAQSDLDLLCS